MNTAQTRRAIAAGMIGNVLEWYDFAIYGYFATQIGRQFFPHEDPVAQLLSAFGVLAIGLGVIGGLTPLAATWLVKRTGDEIAPAFLVMAAAAVAFMAILRLRETYRTPFLGATFAPAAA
jgi:MFS family permease